MKPTRVVTEDEWRARLTEDEFSRHAPALEHRDDLKTRILELVRRGLNPYTAASKCGISGQYLVGLLTSDAFFRRELMESIPSGSYEPRTSFGRWVVACPRIVGFVGFAGDLHLGDVIAIAQRAAHSEWITARDATDAPLDVVVLGAKGAIEVAVSRLSPGGVILGLGVGPARRDGFGFDLVTLDDTKVFRMQKQ